MAETSLTDWHPQFTHPEGWLAQEEVCPVQQNPKVEKDLQDQLVQLSFYYHCYHRHLISYSEPHKKQHVPTVNQH